jgi:tryptophanyl-tRNA synthetase
MQTDPARVRLKEPGNPEVCPVFALHQIYSSDELCRWVTEGCRSAGIGCIDCKQPLSDAITAEQSEPATAAAGNRQRRAADRVTATATDLQEAPDRHGG